MAQLVVQFTVLYDLDLLYSDAGLCPRFFVCCASPVSHLKTFLHAAASAVREKCVLLQALPSHIPVLLCTYTQDRRAFSGSLMTTAYVFCRLTA